MALPFTPTRPNPGPKLITNELWLFICLVEQLEPDDTGALFPYAHKPGYHDTREHNDARDGAATGFDYSARIADDRAGPGDKCAAFDWISESARLRGDQAVMNRYARRIQSAFARRDERLRGWREVLTYLDGRLVGFDFVSWATRSVDPSHKMHHHFSKLRRYLADWRTYAGMLSVLAGEPLELWRSGASYYLTGRRPEEDDMQPIVLVRLMASHGGDGTVWRCDMVRRSRIPSGPNGEPVDPGTLGGAAHQIKALGLGDGVVHDVDNLDAFGVEVTTKAAADALDAKLVQILAAVTAPLPVRLDTDQLAQVTAQVAGAAGPAMRAELAGIRLVVEPPAA